MWHSIYLLLLLSYAVKISSFISLPIRLLSNAPRKHFSSHERLQYPSRRDVFFSSVPILTYATLSILLFPFLNPDPSGAACLLGDTSPDCIGYYKVPLDDAIVAYIETPEKLAQYAPGIRWVPPISYPKSYKAAVTEIQSLTIRTKELEMTVLKGNITAAGIDLLGILPRVTVCGKYVISSLQTLDNHTQGSLQRNKLQIKQEISDYGLCALRVEAAYAELLSSLNAVDILLGQTLRGDLGSITAGQIQVLSELRISNQAMAEMLLAIPNNVSIP
jgi:hypothetical protein